MHAEKLPSAIPLDAEENAPVQRSFIYTNKKVLLIFEQIFSLAFETHSVFINCIFSCLFLPKNIIQQTRLMRKFRYLTMKSKE